MKRSIRSLIAAMAVVAAGAGAASASGPVKQHNSNAVWFENWGDLRNATMKVVSPDGQIIELFAASGTPVFQLSGNEILDGVYNFELTAATSEQIKIVNPINNGRGDAASDTESKGYQTSGAFVVERGVIITPPDVTEDEN